MQDRTCTAMAKSDVGYLSQIEDDIWWAWEGISLYTPKSRCWVTGLRTRAGRSYLNSCRSPFSGRKTQDSGWVLHSVDFLLPGAIYILQRGQDHSASRPRHNTRVMLEPGASPNHLAECDYQIFSDCAPIVRGLLLQQRANPPAVTFTTRRPHYCPI